MRGGRWPGPCESRALSPDFPELSLACPQVLTAGFIWGPAQRPAVERGCGWWHMGHKVVFASLRVPHLGPCLHYRSHSVPRPCHLPASPSLPALLLHTGPQSLPPVSGWSCPTCILLGGFPSGPSNPHPRSPGAGVAGLGR